MDKFFKVWILLGLSILIGCAAGTAESDIEQRITEMGWRIDPDTSAIPVFRINGWTQLDHQNVVIMAGVNNRYLVRLSAPCLSLNGAFRIGFVTPVDQTDRFESILIRSPGGQIDRCEIDNIHRLYPLQQLGTISA